MNAERRAWAARWGSALGGMLALALVGYWVAGPRLSEAQPNPTAEPAAPVVRGYLVPKERLADALDELRGSFPGDTGARFAIDQRRGQILAVAPSELQPQIGRRLAEWLKGATEAEVAPPGEAPAVASDEGAEMATSDVSPPRVTRRVLKHIQATELEARLRALWGNKLRASRKSEQVVSLTIPGDSQSAALQLDLKHNVVQLIGASEAHAALQRLIDAFDRPDRGNPTKVQLVARERATDPQFRSSLAVLQAALESQDTVAQEKPNDNDTPNVPSAPNAEPADPAAPGEAEMEGDDERGLLGPVRIEVIPEFNAIVIIGKKRDVERVEEIIRDLERQSRTNRPTIQVFPLRHANNEGLATLVNQVYTQFLSGRQGPVGIYPLVKPNALLLVGQADSLEVVIDLINKLDRPVTPSTLWRVFPLEYLSATEASQTVIGFYNQRGATGGVAGGAAAGAQGFQGQQGFQGLQGQQGFPGAQGAIPGAGIPQGPVGGAAATAQGLGVRVEVVPENRSNSLIVRGSPRDLEDIATLLKKIDVADSLAQSEVRIFKLQNTMARDLATTLSAAIRGQTTAGTTTGGAQGAGGFQGFQQPGGGAGGGLGGQQQQVRSTSLNFVRLDKEGQKIVASGIPGEIVVNADNNSNSLIIRANKKTMLLIEAIIEELDSLPDASAQIKVYTIEHSDATYLAQMLQQLFGQQVTIGRGTGGLGGLGNVGNQLAQAGLNTGDSSLVPLRFAVDARTNSIIVSGSAGDLKVVEALLIRLDEDDVPTRRIAVYRLKNAFAQDVTTAVTTFLTQQRQVVQQNLAFNVAIDPFEQLEREVAIAAEPQSNSVIISATPQFYDRILEMIEKLDFRPSMVMVQVVIAEVRLTDIYEMGVELGLQDSLLFDRGKASLAGANPAATPGFNFGGTNLPNANSVGQSNLAGQALSGLGVGRANSTLGYGGLVLSAASDSVNVLIRALQDTGRLQILSRPQVMAVHNRQASVLVGSKVPRITGSTINNLGNTQNSVVDVDVGLILNIIPQINDDGVVLLSVQAERSRLGPEEQGVVIAVNSNGDPIRQPQIETTSAVTTISARDGQTVVFAGLISTDKVNAVRGVPYLSNLPVLGNLFRYEADSDRRSELLIVMTPRIVKYDEDYEWINATESERMSWCLADVVNLHGDVGLRGPNNIFCCDHVPVIYPDQDPTGSQHLRPRDARSPDDPLHGPGRPKSSRPVTGQPGGGAPSVPSYVQPSSLEHLPPPPVSTTGTGVQRAGWSQGAGNGAPAHGNPNGAGNGANAYGPPPAPARNVPTGPSAGNTLRPSTAPADEDGNSFQSNP